MDHASWKNVPNDFAICPRKGAELVHCYIDKAIKDGMNLLWQSLPAAESQP
jgi:hypothetical protein